MLVVRVREALQNGPEWELVFVDDGSTDGTFAELEAVAAADDRVKVVSLRRNFGQSAATQAGLDAARGDVLGGALTMHAATVWRAALKTLRGYRPARIELVYCTPSESFSIQVSPT